MLMRRENAWATGETINLLTYFKQRTSTLHFLLILFSQKRRSIARLIKSCINRHTL